VVAKALALVGGIAWVSSWFGASLGVPEGATQMVGYLGQGVLILGLLVLVFSIRCPRCKARPASAFMNRSSASKWLLELEDATACPSCGYHPMLENRAHEPVPTVG
jgi:DNA-directed RNA polymerase subunit RPC12/RpoP